jgi:selenide,water dikinase
LAHVLQPIRDTFQSVDFPHLLVGLDRADDAAVYQLNEQQAIISTTDFFPPIVDDPYDFGAIAAANAMSDVYAMGGQVLLGINLVAFPANLDKAILQAILRGGAEKMAEAGGVVVGGHSVEDKEPKYGLAVTGIIDPELVKRKGGARPGDALVLTKPLGAGVVTTALKNQQAEPADVAAATESMKKLNKLAAESALAAGAHGMTDITGFGLLGHAQEMAAAAGVDFHFELAALPWLPGTQRYAAMGAFPGGMGRNQEYFAPSVEFGNGVDLMVQDMLWTPETSGGLLIALPPDAVTNFQELCPAGVVVGNVVAGSGRIKVA